MSHSRHDPFLVHPAARIYIDIIDLLIEAATESARLAAKKLKRRPPKRGLTLQPGPDTPLWNELVR